jgi:hypothetical protein
MAMWLPVALPARLRNASKSTPREMVRTLSIDLSMQILFRDAG